LQRSKVVTPEDFLDMIGPLLSPALFDNIKKRLVEREAAEAQFLHDHPEVALEQAKRQR